MGESYTRLWILGINISDFLETPAQMVLHFDNSSLVVNRELKSAINFLISPFSKVNKKTTIQMYYNNIELDIDFPDKMLQLSVTTHLCISVFLCTSFTVVYILHFYYKIVNKFQI